MSRAFSTTIDLRNLAPTAHPAPLLAAFDALEPGSALELIHNDDPAPFRVALERRAPESVGWELLEAGPERWRIGVLKRRRHTACCGSCG